MKAALVHNTLHCFCFNDAATSEIYSLSLHGALPIWAQYLLAELEARLPDGLTVSCRPNGRDLDMRAHAVGDEFAGRRRARRRNDHEP